MKNMKLLIGWLFCLFSAALIMAPPCSAAELPAMTVGRIFHIEGDLLRYVPEEKDWVAAVPDAPFGAGDTLFSGNGGMSELIVPNGVWIRTGNGTQIQFITLDMDLAEMDVASGMVRLYGKGEATLKATTPFGYVLADPGTIFDLYVGENSLDVVAIKGTVSFVHGTNHDRYDVTAGATSILADLQQVSSGDGTVDPVWNRWNMDRENFWLARDQGKGPSVEYLPPELRNEAYALEENGSWERIPYEGQERWFWRPTFVAAGWSPFTVGRWTDWYGDQTWIPAEPFGYVTHHYGNWIYTGNHWYWAPPVVRVRVGLPLLNIGFFWSPGRVAWIHSGVHVGWVPLAPRETYYCRRPWGGPHTVIVNNVNINRISINLRSHAYVDRAVIINRNDFRGRDDYRNLRVTHINRTTVINNYRTAPVVNDTVINNDSTDRRRFNFTNRPVQEKPHNTVINRIRDNETIIREGRRETAPVLREQMKGIPAGRVNRDTRVEPPRGMNHIVPAGDIHRPKAELNLPQREIKGGGVRGVPSVESGRPSKSAERADQARPERRPQQPQTAMPAERAIPSRPSPPGWGAPGTGRVAPAAPAQPGQTALPAFEQVVPARPGQPARPAPSPKPAVERGVPASPAPGEPTAPGNRRIAPEPPATPARPVKQAERAAPARPAQPEPSAPRTERAAPARPVPSAQPTVEQVSPARPAQPEPAAPRTERVAPAGPPKTEPSARPAERIAPVQPAAPVQTTRPAERVAPAKPPQTEQPARSAERVSPARPAPPEPVAPKAERAAPAKPAQPEPARPESTMQQPESQEPRERPGRREQPDDLRRSGRDRK